ncbi:MAG TPA: Amuc_1099 family pilus-like system protein [Chthoniobacterales bacterium]|nr:Amuc_1099 family pilus-like system protein [Chthoniobacterales bacterium]
MDWIRANYDRVLVMAAVAVLLLASFGIWRNATSFTETVFAQQISPSPKPAKPPGLAAALERAAAKLQQPPQWTFSGRSGLFVPEKHFIAANGLPTTLQTTQVHPPVPNEWFEEFNLPISDADVLTQDPDTDGFSNLDEFQGKTNPIDKNSHPDYLAKLKLKSFSEEPFRLMFSSWVDDPTSGQTFGINTIDLKQPTQFVKVGDIIPGTRFKVLEFEEKYQPNQYGTNVDVSQLLLEHQETKDRLTLVKEKIAVSPESVATFTYAWPAGQPAREFQVRKDQEFSLKPQEEIKYKLIDVQPSKAVILNMQKPNDQIQIGQAAP